MKMMPMLKKTAVIPGGQISPLMLWNVLNQPAQENLWRVKFKLGKKHKNTNVLLLATTNVSILQWSSSEHEACGARLLSRELSDVWLVRNSPSVSPSPFRSLSGIASSP